MGESKIVTAESLKIAADEAFVENNSAEYVAAHETFGVHAIAYLAHTAAYRSGKIGDDEFLAARKVYDEATEVFDAAFAKEGAR